MKLNKVQKLTFIRLIERLNEKDQKYIINLIKSWLKL